MGALGNCYYGCCRTGLGRSVVRLGLTGLRRVGFASRFHLPLDALYLDGPAAGGLMRLWPRVHWSSGDGMMPPRQLLALYRLAVGWPVEGATVELGAWTGLTTCYLATACRVRGQGRVYAVDTFEGSKENGRRYRAIERHGGSTLRAFEERVRVAGVDDLVEPLIGRTEQVVGAYRGGPIRFLLIDADHSFDGVRRDFEMWSPLVAPGGLIVFHDYLMPDVARFVDGELPNYGGFDLHPGHVEENVVAVCKGLSGPPAS